MGESCPQPGCHFVAANVHEEVKHMNEAHPEVVEKRLRDAGLHEEADRKEAVQVYTAEQMNTAIARVETAKQNHPVGWGFLDELNLPKGIVVYTFANADAHRDRLLREDDKRVIYSVGWLNGLGIGVALGEQRRDS